jgi:hypothetical protein
MLTSRDTCTCTQSYATLSSSYSSSYIHTTTHTPNVFHASKEATLFFYLPLSLSQLYTAVLMKGRVLSSYFGEEILEYSAAR